MIKYKVEWGNITAYNVFHESEETVTYHHRFFQSDLTEPKKSSRSQWFDTWEEAIKYLIDKATEDVDFYKEQYNKARAKLKNAKKIEKPAVENLQINGAE